MGKRRWGDRKDGVLLRDLDAMHFIMPNIWPGRCNNEAFISERIDLTALDAWLKARAEAGETKYSVFDVFITAFLKVITLRPRLNRFIANGNFYQRTEVSAAFLVRTDFTDDGDEGLVFIRSKSTDTLADIHNEMTRQIEAARAGNGGSTDDAMDAFNRLPRFIGKAALAFCRFLDRHGWVPQSFIEEDPYYSSVIFTNLGSIRLHAGYHHLTNWGTTSIFAIVGEKKPRPFYDRRGNMTMKDSIDLGLTIDERIGDGLYFSKSIRMFKRLIEHPELLEQPLDAPV